MSSNTLQKSLRQSYRPDAIPPVADVDEESVRLVLEMTNRALALAIVALIVGIGCILLGAPPQI